MSLLHWCEILHGMKLEGTCSLFMIGNITKNKNKKFWNQVFLGKIQYPKFDQIFKWITIFLYTIQINSQKYGRMFLKFYFHI
jgi:hypothetical protein